MEYITDLSRSTHKREGEVKMREIAGNEGDMLKICIYL